ncbi:MAG: adenylate kinase [candidate division Zixibacteria bacterium]|nr:adenylate kinase [candidate division Zixibacteria bacterium]
MNLVFLGPPGSGKGTQALRVAKELNLTHISTGDLLREAVKNMTELGRQAEEFMNSGNLVPDELIVKLIEEKISNGDEGKGVILDGFPRTMPQAESLKKMFEQNQEHLDSAVLLEVSDEEVVKRLSGRWFCPKCNAGYNYPSNRPKQEGLCDSDGQELLRRPDDDEAVVKNRLDVYKKQTQPIEEFYRQESILKEIKGEQQPDIVFQDILAAVKN